MTYLCLTAVFLGAKAPLGLAHVKIVRKNINEKVSKQQDLLDLIEEL